MPSGFDTFGDNRGYLGGADFYGAIAAGEAALIQHPEILQSDVTARNREDLRLTALKQMNSEYFTD
jgi:hypothetical protein